MNEEFWVQRPSVLFDLKYVGRIFPLSGTDAVEKANAIARLGIFTGIVGSLLETDFLPLIFTFALLTLSVVYHQRHRHLQRKGREGGAGGPSPSAPLSEAAAAAAGSPASAAEEGKSTSTSNELQFSVKSAAPAHEANSTLLPKIGPQIEVQEGKGSWDAGVPSQAETNPFYLTEILASQDDTYPQFRTPESRWPVAVQALPRAPVLECASKTAPVGEGSKSSGQIEKMLERAFMDPSLAAASTTGFQEGVDNFKAYTNEAESRSAFIAEATKDMVFMKDSANTYVKPFQKEDPEYFSCMTAPPDLYTGSV
jgi:hypothetical protein